MEQPQVAAPISKLDNRLERAKSAIERGDTVAHDVAAENGQIFDNVKHMKWFIEAVADEME